MIDMQAPAAKAETEDNSGPGCLTPSMLQLIVSTASRWLDRGKGLLSGPET